MSAAATVHARLKPAADATAARRSAWMKVHTLPGDDAGTAGRRYAALRLPEHRHGLSAAVDAFRQSQFDRKAHAAERARLATRLPGFIALRDDGLSDAVWFALRPDRQWRVRPYRRVDGAAEATDLPCVSIMSRDGTFRRLGAPVDALRLLPGVSYPRNSDAWAAAFARLTDAAQ